MSLQSVAQSLQPDANVDLFLVDTTSVGGTLLRFVQGRETGGDISFGGQEFRAVDIKFEGLETSGVGALPTPTLTLSNTNGIPQSIINTYGGIEGCPVYRLRTFARFLDGHSSPDGESFYGPDIYKIDRKTSENPQAITWELSAAIDQAGKMLPGRQVIRDTCLHRYRRFDIGTGTFDYTKAQCPYTGTNYFNIQDQPVLTAALDQPSRNISCCRKRFGAGAPLPFGGFPGVSRVQM